jgi:hypothetical protein
MEMETLEDYKVYRLDHNGILSYAWLESSASEVLVYDWNRVWDLRGYEREKTETGFRFSAGDSYYEFSPLTLESATEIWPDTIRVFNDLDVLDKFAKKAIMTANSYKVNTVPGEVISFTVDDEDNVLALIKVTDSGDLFYWEGDDWVQVGEDEDHPTIYDQTVIDVEREDIGEAIELWKGVQNSSSGLMKQDILPLAALDQ